MSNRRVSKKKLIEFKEQLEKNISASEYQLEQINSIISGTEDIPSLAQMRNQIKEIADFHESDPYSKINAYHDKLFIDDDDNDIVSTQSQVDLLVSYIEKIKKASEDIHFALEQKKKEIFGYEEEINKFDESGNPVTDEETGEIITTKNQHDGLSQKLETLISNKNKQLNDLYNKHDAKIKELLPGAFSAGLSHAYHSSSEFHKEEENKVKDAFTNTLYIISLCSLVIFFAPIIVLILQSETSAMSSYLIENEWKLKASALTIVMPLIWLALSLQSSMKKHSRLHAEYKHKENLCKTYDGLSQAAADEENTNLAKLLLETTIKASAYNPSETLNSKGMNDNDMPAIHIKNEALKHLDLSSSPLLKSLFKR